MQKVPIKDPWVKRWIAGTNGIHYVDQVDQIKYYPYFDVPIPAATKENAICMDIGTGWGRWMLSIAHKGYIPVGIDIRLDDVKATLNTLKAFDKRGYVVVADLESPPFKSNVFDVVWSFSVIQHVKKEKALSCMSHIARMLNGGGFTKIQFPILTGIRNRFGPVSRERPRWDGDNMSVRYYTVQEYRDVFFREFKDVKTSIHALLGIGVLPEDLQYVSWKQKPLVAISLLGTQIAKLIPGAIQLSDSLYITGRQDKQVMDTAAAFIAAHHTSPSNLNIIHLMQCPLTGGELQLSDDKNWLVSEKAGRRFKVVDEIPVMTESEAL